MKKKLIIFMLASGVALAQFSVGVRIGPPPRPRSEMRPESPGQSYTWVPGYWYANGHRYAWHPGYWTQPPYGGARWAEPRHDGKRFFPGYWDGDKGRVDHDHNWDRQADRDHRQDRDHR